MGQRLRQFYWMIFEEREVEKKTPKIANEG